MISVDGNRTCKSNPGMNHSILGSIGDTVFLFLDSSRIFRPARVELRTMVVPVMGGRDSEPDCPLFSQESVWLLSSVLLVDISGLITSLRRRITRLCREYR